MSRDENVCKTILAIAHAFNLHGDKAVASSAIRHLLREFGHKLQAKKTKAINFISLEASLAEAGHIRAKTINEHVIPLKELVDKILSLSTDKLTLTSPNALALQILLQDHIIVVRITEEEDKKLRDARLASSMPKGWDYDGEWDKRYKTVGIEIQMV